MDVAFRVCIKPISHEQVRRYLEDPPESGICMQFTCSQTQGRGDISVYSSHADELYAERWE